MATKYYALLTNVGAAKLANATALGTRIELTQMAVGDGNGVLPTPDPAQTVLVHEQRREQLNSLTIDPVNTNQIIAEQVIPEDVGGWWIREIGLYDSDGDMIAVANCAETYKPKLQEGSGRVQVVRMILIVSSTASVTLKIDPSVVLATRAYVDSIIIEAKSYAEGLMEDHISDPNPHTQYPLIANALKEMADADLSDQACDNLGLGAAAKRDVGTGIDQIPDMSSFDCTLEPKGYTKLPNGLVFQWGWCTAYATGGTVGATTITLPIAFQEALFTVSSEFSSLDPSVRSLSFSVGESGKTAIKFTYVTPADNLIFWFAVGC
ncbi:MAG: phage tail protein [Hafnia sp.]